MCVCVFVSSNWSPLTVSFQQYPWNPPGLHGLRPPRVRARESAHGLARHAGIPRHDRAAERHAPEVRRPVRVPRHHPRAAEDAPLRAEAVEKKLRGIAEAGWGVGRVPRLPCGFCRSVYPVASPPFYSPSRLHGGLMVTPYFSYLNQGLEVMYEIVSVMI